MICCDSGQNQIQIQIWPILFLRHVFGKFPKRCPMRYYLLDECLKQSLPFYVWFYCWFLMFLFCIVSCFILSIRCFFSLCVSVRCFTKICYFLSVVLSKILVYMSFILKQIDGEFNIVQQANVMSPIVGHCYFERSWHECSPHTPFIYIQTCMFVFVFVCHSILFIYMGVT